MTEPASRLPARPSLEQLRKRAKNLLRDFRAGDADAATRVRAVIPRLAGDGSGLALADAQFVLAREYGFANWAALAQHVERINPSTAGPPRRPPIRPIELRPSRLITLPDGGSAPADIVWSMYLAAHAGDLDHVKALVAKHPGLVRHAHNYTPPVHFAVREGHASLVRFLLDHGASTSYQSYPFGDSLLTIAEDHEHAGVAGVLRERLARQFALTDGLATILDAARRGDLTRVEQEIGRDPSLACGSDDTGMTALHAAANNGHLAIVRALLAAGAPVDATMSDGYRPVHCALIPRGRVRPAPEASAAVADALIAHGAEYTIVVALLRGDRQFAKDALARDSSLANFEDSCHRRPISIAADRDDLEMVRLLLRHGADPNLPEEGAPRGHALWTAVYHRRREMARVLVEHGADPNAMVESSGTPIGHARKDPELLALLRAHGGRDESSDRERLEQLINDDDLAGADRWLTAHPSLVSDDAAFWSEGLLAGPANAGNHAMLELLMRHGARVPKVTKWGRSYYFKHTDTAALLLRHGMDPNHMNWHYTTLLHHVASDGDIPKARLLLDHGATIDAIDEEYRSTPLGMAARWGRTDMVDFLVERGANPNLAGDRWATPVAWARKKGHRDVASLLAGSRGQSP
jgi:ankyrin repeat protein